MKKILAVLAVSCLSTVGFAQQDPQFSQNMYNRLFVNPAYAGSLFVHIYFTVTNGLVMMALPKQELLASMDQLQMGK
jgi:hypothetical protein